MEFELASGAMPCRPRDAKIARLVAAAIQRLDTEWVERLRHDFLILMRNLPRAVDYQSTAPLRDAFKLFRKNFDHFFFQRFLRKSLPYDDAGLSDHDKHYIDKKLRKVGWDFYIELGVPL